MHFGGVGVGAESDLPDLAFRREFAAAKPDSEVRAGAGQIAERLLEFFRVVGQLRDLLFGQNRRDRAARVGAGFAFVATDGTSS